MTNQDTIRLTIRAALIMRLAGKLVDVRSKTIALLTLEELAKLVEETRSETAQVQP